MGPLEELLLFYLPCQKALGSVAALLVLRQPLLHLHCQLLATLLLMSQLLRLQNAEAFPVAAVLVLVQRLRQSGT